MKAKVLSILALLLMAATGAVAQETYKVTMKEGTVEATNWTITPAEATTTGVAQGTEVTATYSGAKKVKSVKAVKKPSSPFANLTSADVGKVIGADGNIYTDKDAATAAGTTAVAIITYVGSDNGEASPYNHGLALALSDANGGSTIQWGYSTTTDNSQHPNYSNSSFTIESGLQYNNATHNSDNYKAFKAAMANNSTAAPTGCSDWFLASGYQWTKMITGAGSAGNLKSLAGLTNNYYWTSSENSAGKAWRYEFNKTRFYTAYKDQSESWVRACLAF